MKYLDDEKYKFVAAIMNFLLCFLVPKSNKKKTSQIPILTFKGQTVDNTCSKESAPEMSTYSHDYIIGNLGYHVRGR